MAEAAAVSNNNSNQVDLVVSNNNNNSNNQVDLVAVSNSNKAVVDGELLKRRQLL